MNIATAQVALPIVVVVLPFEKATLPSGQLTNTGLAMMPLYLGFLQKNESVPLPNHLKRFPNKKVALF